jgi:hypothetical protein
VINDFGAGEVTLEHVDATEEELGPQEQGLIIFEETITKRREPDTVAWIDDQYFASANEGDYEDANGDEGGSRGFTIFDSRTGKVVFEPYASFEHESARIGHYAEGRSENKGGESEAAEYSKFGRDRLLFIGAKRANVLGLYNVGGKRPELLPTGSGPEGVRAIPSRGLLAVSAENSVEDAFPSMITLYRRGRGAPDYPQLASADDPHAAPGVPIPWVAQSGLAADRTDPYTLYSVRDSFLAQSYVYHYGCQFDPGGDHRPHRDRQTGRRARPGGHRRGARGRLLAGLRGSGHG